MHTLVARLLSRKPHWTLVVLLVVTFAAGASAQTFLGARSTVATGISSPMGVAVDSFGNLYVLSNTAQPSVVKIDAATRAVSTYIASGTSINSLVLNRWVGYASGYLKIDAASNLYIPDGTNHRIIQWSTSSNSWIRDWQAADAPIDVAFDSSGALWYTSPGGIYRFNTGSTTVSTLMIDANAMAPVTNPRTLAFDSTDNLFFTDEISSLLYESTQSSGYTAFALPVSRRIPRPL